MDVILSFFLDCFTVIFYLNFNRGELSWLVSLLVSLIFGFLLWFRILVSSLVLNRVCFVLLLLSFCILFSCYEGFAFAVCGVRISPVQSLSAYPDCEDITDLVTETIWSRPHVSALSCNLRHLAPLKGEGAAFLQSSLPGKQSPHTYSNSHSAPFSLLSQGQSLRCEWGVIVLLPPSPLLLISSPGLRISL